MQQITGRAPMAHPPGSENSGKPGTRQRWAARRKMEARIGLTSSLWRDGIADGVRPEKRSLRGEIRWSLRRLPYRRAAFNPW